MLLKLSIVNTNSKVIFKTAITFVSEELSLTEFLVSKEINLNDVCEIKNDAKMMHLKVVVRLEFLSLVYDLNLILSSTLYYFIIKTRKEKIFSFSFSLWSDGGRVFSLLFLNFILIR